MTRPFAGLLIVDFSRLPAIVFVVLIQRHLVQGLTFGAVKG